MFGYVVGYVVIVFVLLLVYYWLGVVLIYELFGVWLGLVVWCLGLVYFVLLCMVGVIVWFYFVVEVFYEFIFGLLGVFFVLGVVVVLVMILFYIVEGGVKVLVWIDML